MEQEEDKAEFEKQTAHLPHVYLPRNVDSDYGLPDCASIDGPDQDGTWWVDPFYYMGDNEGEYRSEEEARQFLINKGYMEIVALDYPNHFGTHWIKKEYYHG